MSLFEALYGRRCISRIRQFEIGECGLIGLEVMYEFVENVRLIRDRLKMAQCRQKYYGHSRKWDLKIMVVTWSI